MIIKSLRLAFSHLARALCEQYVSELASPRVITNRKGDSPYLERYYLLGGPSEDGRFTDAPMTVMLHRFVASDESGELHSHPWEQSVSFILAGGYDEERRANETREEYQRDSAGPTWRVDRRRVHPFSFNFISHDDFHRVDLLEHDCWALFITARKASSWAFWNRETYETTPWREFIARIRGVDVATIADVKRSESIK